MNKCAPVLVLGGEQASTCLRTLLRLGKCVHNFAFYSSIYPHLLDVSVFTFRSLRKIGNPLTVPCLSCELFTYQLAVTQRQ